MEEGNEIITIMQNMEAQIHTAIEDATKFTDSGNKSAGTRLRGTMQNVKSLAQQVRLEVQAQKNA
tara:strand:- start:640 stop:834 length:195 start_codon:yes stop_codon:yes gene_type:complete